MDGAWISENFPYALLAGSFVHALLFTRSARTKILPSSRAFFWGVLSCCVFSVLLKYLFAGKRPAEADRCRALPDGWTVSKVFTTNTGTPAVAIVHKKTFACLEDQPLREIYTLPVSFSNLKTRYGPSSGTPSSHSVLAGYLINKSISAGKHTALFLSIPVLVALSRVAYGFHYPYQVLLGMGFGFAFGYIQ
ncbi:hypothetical protein NECID01_0473 [Nematocida sp. AWRm77]|nr:hypothetical protein NECID01_0473 [Nematocida sp. AWRm77]